VGERGKEVMQKGVTKGVVLRRWTLLGGTEEPKEAGYLVSAQGGAGGFVPEYMMDKRHEEKGMKGIHASEQASLFTRRQVVEKE